jgi:hypothetical protein
VHVTEGVAWVASQEREEEGEETQPAVGRERRTSRMSMGGDRVERIRWRGER